MILASPAYFANGSALVSKGNIALDMGKKFFDGERILGDGKTVEGFLMGVTVGSFIGFLLGDVFFGFLSGFGAMVGDAFGSFVKRRLGLKRGEFFYPWDQIDFLIGAYVFLSPFYYINIYHALIILALTPVVHLLTNVIAYVLKIKKEPW